MKKLKRSDRLVDMTQFLLSRPHLLIPLSTFVNRYGSAKSSISEDLSIIKDVFESQSSGLLQTVAGAAGGVRYIPQISQREALKTISDICEQLQAPARVLPGGYLYMSDLLGQPNMLHQLGKMFATYFSAQEVDVVMTVETKGIPLAYATASYLNVPVVIVRRDNKVTEGSSVSINYISGSTKRIQTMTLARRSLPEHSRVLIIDDFMRAGGTIHGMKELLNEFQATVCGVGVFVESTEIHKEELLVDEYLSLAKLSGVGIKDKPLKLTLGNYFENFEEV